MPLPYRSPEWYEALADRYPEYSGPYAAPNRYRAGWRSIKPGVWEAPRPGEPGQGWGGRQSFGPPGWPSPGAMPTGAYGFGGGYRNFADGPQGIPGRPGFNPFAFGMGQMGGMPGMNRPPVMPGAGFAVQVGRNRPPWLY